MIRAFDNDNAEMTPAAVAAKTKLTRATARRILLTLEALGYVASDGKWFRLSPKILDLSFFYLASMQVDQVIQPLVNEASKKVNEACAVSVLEGHDIISIAQSVIDRFDRVPFHPGTRMPAFVSAAGRVMLADLPEKELNEFFREARLERRTPDTITVKAELRKELEKIRRQGFATVDGELEVGMFTVAAPVCNDARQAIAAVSFGGNAARINASNVEEKYLPGLLLAAREISRLLPHRNRIVLRAPLKIRGARAA